MKKTIREHLPALLAGILGTGLFIYFIDPILRFVARVAVEIAGNLSQTFVDSIYAGLAKEAAFDYAFYWIAILFLSVAFACFLIVYELISQSTETPKPEKKDDRWSEVRFIAALVVIMIGALFLIYFASIRFYEQDLATDFELRMQAVAPYIDEQSEEMLRSRWVLMSGEEDYDLIVKDLKRIAAEFELDAEGI